MMGVWMQRLAVGWLTWELTQSEAWIGAIAFTDLIPVVLLGPLAGVWVDRPVRKLLIKFCQSVMLVQSLVLFLLVYSGLITIWLLFALVLLNGIIAAIYHPVRLSVVPSLVGADRLMAAISMTAVTFNIARFAGPALGGLVIAWHGIPASFLFVAISYLVMLVAVFLIRIPSRPWLEEQVRRSALSELREGAAYALGHRAICYVLFSQVIIALFARPLGELLPAFVGSVFMQGSETLAVFTSAMGIGAMLAGLRLLLWETRHGLVSLVITSMGLSGVMVVLFCLVQQVWVAAVVIFLMAYWVSVCGIGSQTLIQTFVDKKMRGRVISIWASIYRGAPGVGALLIGGLAGVFGLAGPNIAAAVICVLSALWMFRRRALIRDEFRRQAVS